MTGRRTSQRPRESFANDRPSRWKILWRRHRRTLPLIVFLAMLVGLGVGVSAILHDTDSEARFAPLRAKLIELMPLRVREISISGRHLTTENSLMEALGTHVGAPMFGISVEAARKRIDALPFVDHAIVERHLPDTIIVRLTERSPVAVWQTHGQFELINARGERVPDQGMKGKDAEAFVKLPLVVGDGANVAAGSLIEALDAQPTVKAFVIAAVRVGQRRWNLSLRDGTTVMLPEGQEPAALARLATYQASHRLLERPVVSIDMRLPDRLIIHENPSAQPAATPPAADRSADRPKDAATEDAPTEGPAAGHADPADHSARDRKPGKTSDPASEREGPNP